MAHRPDLSPGAPAGQAAAGKGERAALALARAGVASRRDAERMIEAGRVAVNGRVLEGPAVTVESGDILTVDGRPVSEPQAARLWRYHKPAGLLTAHKDPKGRPTVFAALPAELGRVISVGRLDLSSEGLLLLTNAGDAARALELPATGLLRRYRARAFGRVSQERLDRLREGVTVDGIAYGPIRAQLEKSGGGSNVWLTVELAEGKNREVRTVLEHVGLKVNRLIRTSYGPFDLGDLPSGAVEEVAPQAIRQTLGALLPHERLPKGEKGRLFRWTPPAPQRGHGDALASPARGGGGRVRQGRTAGGKSAAPAPPGTPAPPQAVEPSKAKKAYKPGWARPKPKAGPKRPPRRPKGG
ncbi:MAG TPA: pseudouridine synthase [Caulobacteraceae bacterium]|jgi:23S rRNA pseudouridine2605 synthase